MNNLVSVFLGRSKMSGELFALPKVDKNSKSEGEKWA